MLVKIKSGKNEVQEFRYVAECRTNVKDGIYADKEIPAQGFRCLNANKTKFIQRENDKFIADFNDIISVLEPPNISLVSSTRIEYIFKGWIVQIVMRDIVIITNTYDIWYF